MPVFISYSHRDKDFVDQLAMHLVKNNVYVWVDRWELAAGDSLIQRVQDFLKGSSALLVILSKASLESEWCKKELACGLMRELEERKAVVIPVLIEDCAIPPFLKEKLYADFRTDFDAGLRDVLKAVAKHTSDSLGRTDPKDAEYHYDWGVSWDYLEGRIVIEIIAASHSEKFPFTVLAVIQAYGNDAATQRYQHFEGRGYDWFARRAVVYILKEFPQHEAWKFMIDNSLPVKRNIIVKDSKSDLAYDVHVSVRRLGEDTGMGILYDVEPIVAGVYQQMESARRDLSETERQDLMRTIREK